MDQSLVIGNMAVQNLIGDVLEHQMVFIGIGEVRRAEFIVHIVYGHRHHVDSPVSGPFHGAIALVGEDHIAFLKLLETGGLQSLMVAKNPGIAPPRGLLLFPRHVTVVHGRPHRPSLLDHPSRPRTELADLVELAAEATQDLHGGLVVFLHEEHRMTKGWSPRAEASPCAGFSGLNFRPVGGPGHPGSHPGASSQKQTSVDLVTHPCLPNFLSSTPTRCRGEAPLRSRTPLKALLLEEGPHGGIVFPAAFPVDTHQKIGNRTPAHHLIGPLRNDHLLHDVSHDP